ncbi:MAG: hypothetical protein O3B41_07080 [Bacteroidetes bacterium]|nr:hypothetical protein [Bacteroidota bacterium]
MTSDMRLNVFGVMDSGVAPAIYRLGIKKDAKDAEQKMFFTGRWGLKKFASDIHPDMAQSEESTAWIPKTLQSKHEQKKIWKAGFERK